MKREPFLTASVSMKSQFKIEELGIILSEKIFGGIPFEGLEEAIYDEIPAIFFKRRLLGFNFVLQGYDGLDNEIGYILSMIPNFTVQGVEYFTIQLNNYFFALFKERLKDYPEILVIQPKS